MEARITRLSKEFDDYLTKYSIYLEKQIKLVSGRDVKVSKIKASKLVLEKLQYPERDIEFNLTKKTTNKNKWKMEIL